MFPVIEVTWVPGRYSLFKKICKLQFIKHQPVYTAWSCMWIWLIIAKQRHAYIYIYTNMIYAFALLGCARNLAKYSSIIKWVISPTCEFLVRTVYWGYISPTKQILTLWHPKTRTSNQPMVPTSDIGASHQVDFFSIYFRNVYRGWYYPVKWGS